MTKPAPAASKKDESTKADHPDQTTSDPEQARTRLAATGRNDSCPCGSGKKYKKCCMS